MKCPKCYSRYITFLRPSLISKLVRAVMGIKNPGKQLQSYRCTSCGKKLNATDRRSLSRGPASANEPDRITGIIR